MRQNKPVGVTVSQLTEALKLSRSYVVQRITHAVKHLEDSPVKGTAVIFDEEDLSNWLMTHIEVTRQTKRVNLPEERKRRGAPANDAYFIGDIPAKWDPKVRTTLPAIPAPKFDIWSERSKLIFPKEYHADLSDPKSPILSAEICYRDMYLAGAYKIQLGKQKTMFYLDEVPSPQLHAYLREETLHPRNAYFLVPADWHPYYKKQQTIPAPEKEPGAMVSEAPIQRYEKDPTFTLTIQSKEFEYDPLAVEHAIQQGFDIRRVLKACSGTDPQDPVTVKMTVSPKFPVQVFNTWKPKTKSYEAAAQDILEKSATILNAVDQMADEDHLQIMSILDQAMNKLKMAQHEIWIKQQKK